MRITAQRTVTPDAPPEAVYRPVPELAHWLLDHDLRELRAAGAFLGCSRTQVMIITKPFDDPAFRPPRRALLEVIVERTRGAITGEHFVPPHLRQPRNAPTLAAGHLPADPEALRLARAM